MAKQKKRMMKRDKPGRGPSVAKKGGANSGSGRGEKVAQMPATKVAKRAAQKSRARRPAPLNAPMGKPTRKPARKPAPQPAFVEIQLEPTAAANPAPVPVGVLSPGLDLSVNSTEQVACFAAAGKQFVSRYYSRGKKPKIIRRAEALAITQAQMNIVAVWEDGSPTNAGYFSRAKGVADGTEAHRRATEIGQPTNTPIYFAVDYDASVADVRGAVSEYFRGVAEGLGAAGSGAFRYLVGGYGSGAVCEWLLTHGLATFTWLAQSSGWRGFGAFKNWNIKQGATKSLCTLDVDLDSAVAQYGGFRVT